MTIHRVFLGVTFLATRAWLRPVSRGNLHFTVGGGRLRQSGPRPEGRLLRQPALEGLTRSARTDSPHERMSKAAMLKAWDEAEEGPSGAAAPPRNVAKKRKASTPAEKEARRQKKKEALTSGARPVSRIAGRRCPRSRRPRGVLARRQLSPFLRSLPQRGYRCRKRVLGEFLLLTSSRTR
ncbi:hypothetical protein F511_14516 [Dorcoceras hygrometricum]|uniref:Uncharacterized protein n=1 Tax=Dorcoceras hygrometricum TaxID=472368 RepID=A0A2Z7BNE9_9LAMI|nr:hypothetical protein F511_14516 [Dorcoceras hygrometricum]